MVAMKSELFVGHLGFFLLKENAFGSDYLLEAEAIDGAVCPSVLHT